MWCSGVKNFHTVEVAGILLTFRGSTSLEIPNYFNILQIQIEFYDACFVDSTSVRFRISTFCAGISKYLFLSECLKYF